MAIGVVGRSDASDAGGAATAEVAVLAGRIASIGPFARGRHDFGRRVSGTLGLELSLRITEVLVVAPSIGVATDGTAGVVGACFVGVRSGVPADGRFRFDLASLGVAASMQQLGSHSDLV